LRVTLINLWPTGGMMHYASALANALARRPGLEVTLLVPEEAELAHLSPAVRVRPVPLSLRRGAGALAGNLLQLARVDRFWRAVAATSADVLHVNSSHPWLVATLRWLARRYPIVATVHEIDPHPGENTRRKRLETRAVLDHASRIAVHGDEIRARLLTLRPERAPAQVVTTPHGPYEHFAAGSTNGRGPARPTVLFFGRILAYKGLEVLLRAAPLVRVAVPDVRFVVAGEGDLTPYRALLDDPNLVETRNVYVPESEVSELFRDAGVLVLPYIEASWSGVASIAHAFGLPVVATSVGCLPDAVQHGKNGLIIPPNDVCALARALSSVLLDEGLRARLARGARETRVRGWDEAAETLEFVYRELRDRPWRP